MFGVRCPGCGLTRSFVALTHGDWAESTHYHRLGPIVYFYLLALILFHTYGALQRNFSLPRALVRAHHWGGLLLCAALLVNWIWA